MFFRLLLLFSIVPLVELAVLLKVGSVLGVFETICLVVVTAILGAALARYEGLKTLYRIRESLSVGAMPTDELLEGLMILIAAALLVTPGLITDGIGFLALIPYTRRWIRDIIKRRFGRLLSEGRHEIRYW